MGFLQRSGGATPSLADHSKGVISVWATIPAASLSAARSQYMESQAVFPNTDMRLPGVIPFLTFGPVGEEYTIYDGLGAAISSGEMSPCVLGVACGEAEPGSEVFDNVLYARLQYSSGGRSATVANTVYHDFFQVGARLPPATLPGAGVSGSNISVSGDVWHHTLMSYDLSSACSTTATGGSPGLVFNSLCRFHWAFDDVNYASSYLWPNNPLAVSAADVPNGIVSDTCMNFIDGGSFDAGNIPTAGQPVGVPSSADYTDFIYDVRLARLQVFTGVSIDTSVEENRRAFITSDLRPASLSLARALLGVEPKYEFDKGEDIIAGRNTGSGGSFTATGTITAFTPGPGF